MAYVQGLDSAQFNLPGADLAQLAGQGRRYVAVGLDAEVGRRVLGIEVTPALEGAARGGDDAHDVLVERDLAPGVHALAHGADVEHALTAEDHALEDAVHRAAVDHLGGTLGSLAGAQDPRLPRLMRATPREEVLDRVGSDAELDHVQGHGDPRLTAPRRSSAMRASASAWPPGGPAALEEGADALLALVRNPDGRDAAGGLLHEAVVDLLAGDVVDQALGRLHRARRAGKRLAGDALVRLVERGGVGD